MEGRRVEVDSGPQFCGHKDAPPADCPMHAANISDVLQWISVQDNQVSAFPNLNGPNFGRDSKHLGRRYGCAANRFKGRQPSLHEQLKFTSKAVSRYYLVGTRQDRNADMVKNPGRFE